MGVVSGMSEHVKKEFLYEYILLRSVALFKVFVLAFVVVELAL